MNVIILNLSLGLHASIAVHPQWWLDRAEREVTEGHYAAAADIYASLLAWGFASADLEYNLGVCALASGDLGRAIYYLRRATQTQPYERRFAQALEEARRWVVDPPKPPRQFARIAWWANRVALTGWAIGWCCLVGLHFRGGRRFGVAGLVFLTAALVSLTLGTYYAGQEKRMPWAVVRERCEVRIGNGESYPVATQQDKPLILLPGWEIQVIGQRSNGWVYIAVEGTPVGWITKSYLYLSAEPIQWD
jgi:hypothetical protein